MFVSTAIARRLERAEAEMMRVTVAATTPRAPDAFVLAIDGGVATFVRRGSPMNKVIGAGLDAPIDAHALDELEAELRRHDEPVRVELSTLAAPEAGTALTARGYRLLGFENLLVRPIADARETRSPAVRVERVTAATRATWRDVDLEAFLRSDDTGVAVDAFSRDAMATVLDDVLASSDHDRYLAFVDGVPAGAASMCICDGVALLTGSATLVEHRRRGVQAALIGARLDDARARGAELAVITTAPGSQSQANVMKHGFALAYARAILVSP